VNEIVKSIAVMTVLAMLGGLAVAVTDKAVRAHNHGAVVEGSPVTARPSGSGSLPYGSTVRDSASVKESR
jgi:hypothetical protein